MSRLCGNRSRPDRHSSREPSQDLLEDFLLLFKMRSLETWMMLAERLKNSFALLTSWVAPSTLFSNQRTFDNIVFLNNQKRNKNKTKQTIRLNAKSDVCSSFILFQAIPLETNKINFVRIISGAHIIAQAECMNDARLRVITAQRIKVNTKTHFST